MPEHKFFYRRNMPHFQPQQAIYSITYRLAGSIPITKIKELSKKYQSSSILPEEYFEIFDNELDFPKNGPYWLQEDEIAQVVADSLHFNDNKQYKLWSYNIMPNHVHLIIELLQNSLPLYTIMQKHKGFTARQCNKLLKKTGLFWQHESYDHVIRDAQEFYTAINYILWNAAKAGLVSDWREWKWAYVHPDLKAEFEAGLPPIKPGLSRIKNSGYIT